MGSSHLIQRVDDGSIVSTYKDAVSFDDLSIAEDLMKNLAIINSGSQLMVYDRMSGEILRKIFFGKEIRDFSYDSGKIIAIDKAGDLNYVRNLLEDDEVVLSGIDASMEKVSGVKIIPETEYSLAFSQTYKKVYIISLNLDMENKISGKILIRN